MADLSKPALGALAYLKAILGGKASNLEKSFSASDVLFNNAKGLAATPNNSNINYMGGAVMMRPSEFLQIATPRSGEISPKVRGAMNPEGGTKAPVASPQLYFNDLQQPYDFVGPWIPRVTGHEGRNRMQAMLDWYGDSPIPVQIKSSERARDLTPEDYTRLRLGGYKTQRGERGEGFGNGAGVIGDEFINYRNGGAVKGYAGGGDVAKEVIGDSPATAIPGLAQLAEWMYQGAGKAVPRLVSKAASLPGALHAALAFYSPDTATDEEERSYMNAARFGGTQDEIDSKYEAEKNAIEASARARAAERWSNATKNHAAYHFKHGGLVQLKKC